MPKENYKKKCQNYFDIFLIKHLSIKKFYFLTVFFIIFLVVFLTGAF